MTIREQAALDSAAILAADGESATLTDLAGTDHPVKVHAYRIGMRIDPGTGLLSTGDQSSITVSLADLSGALPEEGWRASFTDSTGAAVTGRVNDVALDRTLNRATLWIKV